MTSKKLAAFHDMLSRFFTAKLRSNVLSHWKGADSGDADAALDALVAWVDHYGQAQRREGRREARREATRTTR